MQTATFVIKEMYILFLIFCKIIIQNFSVFLEERI